jgi:hypothetical protein
VNSRAWTSTPSRALKVITFGSIQPNDFHSAVGVDVTAVAGAPGRLAATNTSGGLLLYE